MHVSRAENSSWGDSPELSKIDTVHNDEALKVLENYGGEHEWTELEEKKLRRKIDWRLMPVLCATYGLQYYDKAMLSQAVSWHRIILIISLCSQLTRSGTIWPADRSRLIGWKPVRIFGGHLLSRLHHWRVSNYGSGTKISHRESRLGSSHNLGRVSNIDDSMSFISSFVRPALLPRRPREWNKPYVHGHRRKSMSHPLHTGLVPPKLLAIGSHMCLCMKRS